MKTKYRSIAFTTSLLVLLGLMQSCTLIMDDELIPDEELGFGEPYTRELDQEGLHGSITYEFHDDVKSITHNVEEYIHHIDDDSIIYYFDNTPEEWVPHVGEKLSMPATPKALKGLNHKVISVNRANGLIKVVATKVGYDEVFKSLDGDFTYEIEYPSFIPVDSAMLDSVGIGPEDMELTIWDAYNKYYYPKEYAEMKAKEEAEATRAAKLNPGKPVTLRWHSEPLGNLPHNIPQTRAIDFNEDEDLAGWDKLNATFSPTWNGDEEHPSDGAVLNLLNIDTRVLSEGKALFNSQTVRDVLSMADNIAEEDENGGGKKKGPLYFVSQIQFCIKSKLHIQVALIGPILNVKVIEKSDNSINFVSELGASGSLSDKIVEKVTDLLKKRLQGTRFEPVLPKGRFPIPAVSPAVTVYLQPRFGIGVDIALYGRFEKTINCRPATTLFKFFSNPPFAPFIPHALSRECGEAPASPPAQISLNGSLGITLKGGVETGFDILDYVQLGIYADIEGYAKANVSRTFATDGFCYDPDKNNVTLGIDLAGGIKASAGKHNAEKEVARLNLFKWNYYLMPALDKFSVANIEYDPTELFLRDADVKFRFSSNGWFDRYRKGIALLVVAVPKNGGPKKYFMGDVIDGLIEEGKDYKVKCHFDHNERVDYTLFPYIIMNAVPYKYPEEQDNIMIYGQECEIIGLKDAADVILTKTRQTFGHPVKDCSSAFRSQLVKDFGSSLIKDWWIYGFMAECTVIGGVNIKEWGYELHLYCDEGSGYQGQEFTIPIENDANGPVKSGKKVVDIKYIDSMDPANLFGDYAYKATLIPYYITKSGEKIKLEKDKDRIFLEYPIYKSARTVEKELEYRKTNGAKSVNL